MVSTTYSIQALCEKTGLPRRTIHFYSQQGIIPPPVGAGLAAAYDESHLTRLQLIPHLRQQGLRLDQIRARFSQVSHAELRDMLEGLEHQPTIARKAIPQAQSHLHYSLPAGLLLVAPANLTPANRARLEQLLQAAGEIFNQA